MLIQNKHIAIKRNYVVIFNKILFLYFKNSVKSQNIRYKIYPWIRCELVADPMESAKHTLGTAVLTN
jgi:hypothetical protein